MADNRVEVHVGARTSELERGMNDAEQIVENATENIEEAGRNIDFVPDFSSFRSSIDSISQLVTTRFEEVGTSISASFTRSFAMVGIGIGAAVGTAMMGLATLTSQVGDASKELENQARLANATTTEFQEWAFAAKKVSGNGMPKGLQAFFLDFAVFCCTSQHFYKHTSPFFLR